MKIFTEKHETAMLRFAPVFQTKPPKSHQQHRLTFVIFFITAPTYDVVKHPSSPNMKKPHTILRGVLILAILLSQTALTTAERCPEDSPEECNPKKIDRRETTKSSYLFSQYFEEPRVFNETMFESNATSYPGYNSDLAYQNDLVTIEPNSSEDMGECVGDEMYCNMTKEEYIALLDEYIFPQPYEWVLIASHSLVFLIGLIGNALVCVAVYRNHSMRTVTNYFIVNLAVADFMVILFCLPPTVLWDVTETWFFGNAMCRIVLYFQVSAVLLCRFEF